MKISNYGKPTPVVIELISDCLMIISTSITGYAIGAEDPTLAYISLICGTLSKIIVRFLKSNEVSSNHSSDTSNDVTDK